jgi:hypothetical protein
MIGTGRNGLRIRGGYATPIVEALTPYTVAAYTSPDGGGAWAPSREAGRLDRYAEYEALVENRPWEVFADLQLKPDQSAKVVIALALPELLCNVWADALYGENSPDLIFANADAGDVWAAVWKASGGDDVAGWEAIFQAAELGTSVQEIVRDDDGNVTIASVEPSIFFPRRSLRNPRLIVSVTIAFEEDRAAPEADRRDVWQIRRTYDVGLDARTTAPGRTKQLTITAAERRKGGDSGFTITEVLRPEGVEFLPFVDLHAKRWGRHYWGRSELARITSIYDEIDNVLGNVAEILEYHGSPLLQVPRSALQGGVLPKGATRTMGIARPEDADIARYITYDGQVSAQIAWLDSLIAKVLLVSEVQETYFGHTEGNADSGVALRLRLQDYVKKAGRWARKDAARVEALADLVLRMADRSAYGSPEARALEYVSGSPLPVDEVQETARVQAMDAMGVLTRRGFRDFTLEAPAPLLRPRSERRRRRPARRSR